MLVWPELTAHFTDESRREITKWEWDFNGDGIVDSTYFQQTNPDYTYPSVNTTYSVTLTVTGPGGTDTLTRSDYITVTGCPS